MKKLFVFIFLLVKVNFVNAADAFPIGVWEGYKQVGSTYQEFVLQIDATGIGYYGFSPDINKPTPICFTISKATLLNLISYHKQENKLNGLEFSLILVPSIENTIEAISVMKDPVKKLSFSQSWSLVPIEQNNRNLRLAELCKSFLKKHT